MSELRLNLITGNWVIIATDRASRPMDFRSDVKKASGLIHDPDCPFCIGNEEMTPNDILRFPEKGQWELRVVPNKFAALSAATPPERENDGRLHRVGGFGSHEVIIESFRHDATLIDLEDSHIAHLLGIYQKRFIVLDKTPGIEHVIIFKNHGEAAGTSLLHPHSQIIATPVLPLQVRQRMHEYLRYYDHYGECLMCAMLGDELEGGRRVILESQHFVSFIPYAALSPFHLWVFPRRHQASFGHASDDELKDLAKHLKKLLSMVAMAAGDPSYNYTIRSGAMKSSYEECFHWYLSIVPRVAHAAGFELGTGMYINTSIPEEIAAFLRSFLPEKL